MDGLIELAEEPRPEGRWQLIMAGLVKRYGGVTALDGASLHMREGAVHTIMGQNGCGKSTLLAILSGQTRAEAGSVVFDGSPLYLRSTADALKRGIAMVSQETALAPDLSVCENILLGRLVRGRAGISWPASVRRAETVLRELGLDYDTLRPVRSLRPDQQQMVEIARALSFDARLLIFDEPTSSLTDDEVAHLFKAMRGLTFKGVSVLFVSHRLPEVFEISDSVTVMRDGKTVSTGQLAEYDTDRLVAEMVGDRPTRATVPRSVPPVDRAAGPVLELQHVTVAGSVADASLTVGRGQIVGFAGLEGSGRSELLQAAFGLRAYKGAVLIDDTVTRAGEPRARIAMGVGYVPADRKTSGLILNGSVGRNLSIVATHALGRWRFATDSLESELFSSATRTMSLRAASPRADVSSLSGGNQQKVALAKWLAVKPKVLLLDEPTRGVDIAAKRDIHAQLQLSARAGLGLLVSSSDTPELLSLCDEIVVMHRGRLVKRLKAAETTEAEIAHLAGGNQ